MAPRLPIKSANEKQEEKEVKDSKEEGKDERKEEAKSDAMEVDGAGNANEQRDDKVADSEEAGSKNHAIIDRPVRERKPVERYELIEQEFHIEKGSGTALKDIPNVAYKLSKKKVSETLKLLHTVLFVRKGKALEIKSNILRFSGFVWNENEEKQKAKVHEKLDKVTKEKLFEFCDLLDIPITRTTAKKEDVIALLIDFLLVPHATTLELLAEKEQSSEGNKRKRVNIISASTPDSSKRRSKSTSNEQKATPKTEELEQEQEDDGDNQNVNVMPVKTETEENESEPESTVKSSNVAVKEETLVKPSDDELNTAICQILKEVYFDTTTFLDVVKMLSERFSTNLTPRKETIISLTKEEITRIAFSEEEALTILLSR